MYYTLMLLNKAGPGRDIYYHKGLDEPWPDGMTPLNNFNMITLDHNITETQNYVLYLSHSNLPGSQILRYEISLVPGTGGKLTCSAECDVPDLNVSANGFTENRIAILKVKHVEGTTDGGIIVGVIDIDP